ncbi:MAG: Hint domain-containing protein [bacterium]
MADWIALSDRIDPPPAAQAVLERGLFVLEFALPIVEPAVLLHWKSDTNTLSVFFDPDTGLSVLHRQGSAVKRHVLKGPLPQRSGTARMSLSYDAAPDTPRQHWQLTYDVLGESLVCIATGPHPLALTHADLHALCTGAEGSKRHNATLWFGATNADILPDRAPWIGLNTPVETRRGPVRASLLKPGDLIATLDHGFLPLQGLIHRSLPSRGSFAPVVLRSPFFGLTQDILVSSDQLVLISGASVEYLYGVEEALISAGSLCDNQVAVKDERRALTDSVALDFGRPVTFTADGCCLMSAYGTGAQLPYRALMDYEALPLLTLLGRTALRHVA